jgi:hypothetical protein
LAVWVRALGVVLPLLTSMGVSGSTPEKAAMPPAMPVELTSAVLQV